METDVVVALNHMVAPALDVPRFFDLAAGLGCRGVEIRNDLGDGTGRRRPGGGGGGAAGGRCEA